MAIRHRVHGLYQSLSRTDFKLTLVLDKKMNFYASLCSVRAEEALFFCAVSKHKHRFLSGVCFETSFPALLSTNGSRRVLDLLKFLSETHVKLRISDELI